MAAPRRLESSCGAQKREPDGVRGFRTRRELRLKQRREEKAVSRQFYGAGLAATTARAHAQPRGLEQAFVLFIDAEVAEVLFSTVLTAANRME